MRAKLTKQEKKVYDYICAHRGCTTRDIQRDLGIECPSARITGMRNKEVQIKSIGQKKYPGARPFEMYAIENASPKVVYVERLNEEGQTVRVPQLIA